VSATQHSANKPTTGKGPDPKAAKKHHLKLDAHLKPIRDVIESQPKVIQVTLSDTVITMLPDMWKLREKQAGLINLAMNTGLFPCSAKLLVILDYPKELKDDEQTLENVQEWNDFIKKTKNELKNKIVKEEERTADYYQEQCLLTFKTYSWLS
jgi:anaerobic C4-dicarboxylate transporter